MFLKVLGFSRVIFVWKFFLYQNNVYNINLHRCDIAKAVLSQLVTEEVTRRCSVKKAFLEIPQNSQENTCARVPFIIKLQALAFNFIKKETLTKVFSCEYYEISKNTFRYRTAPVAASVVTSIKIEGFSYRFSTLISLGLIWFMLSFSDLLWFCNAHIFY